MSGPFKLKYKNSAFPFKEPTGPTDIISAAGSAYTPPKDISVAADFLKGFATGLPTSTTSSDKKEKKKKRKIKKANKKEKARMKKEIEKKKEVGKILEEGAKPKGKGKIIPEGKIPSYSKPTWEW